LEAYTDRAISSASWLWVMSEDHQHPLDTSQIRFRLDPADVPPEKAARRLHLTAERFAEVLPALIAFGFPSADPDTRMFDLQAIDLRSISDHQLRWITSQYGDRPASSDHVAGRPCKSDRVQRASLDDRRKSPPLLADFH
jgi:hypothetical protein